MALKVSSAAALLASVNSALALDSAERNSSNPQLLNLLFVGDIGHAREGGDHLTFPWPMDKGAHEGAFSLYEGMYDYVTRQGANPSALVVLGDVAYGGGSSLVNEDTRVAFQKYLAGKVAEDRVFVTIGNHDVHYMGCEQFANTNVCYYGDKRREHWASAHNMTFGHWRQNWIDSFPGLATSISPPGIGVPWQAPMRYNLNLEKASSVYLIGGLNSGVGVTKWNDDTPPEAEDARRNPNMECQFLRDSLAHGRSLGKTVFIYMTHHFNNACHEWPLIRQIDIWLYGHKHNFWQSPLNGEVVVQEHRHYPVRLLIGNGGFDEGHIDAVNFGHVTETIIPGTAITGADRVRLDFKIFDTCVTGEEKCPDSRVEIMASCWKKCQDFPGGYDNGGGPRKAVPSSHGFGFSFDAPRVPVLHPPHGPLSGSFRIQVLKNSQLVWLTLGVCPWSLPSSAKCLRATMEEKQAAKFDIYSAEENLPVLGETSVRLAVDDDARAPVMAGWEKAPSLLYQPALGFWADSGNLGLGSMHPSKAHAFTFTRRGEGMPNRWKMLNAGWKSVHNHIEETDALEIVEHSFLEVEFVRSEADEETVIV